MAGASLGGKIALVHSSTSKGSGFFPIGTGRTAHERFGEIATIRDFAKDNAKLVYLGPQDGLTTADIFYQLQDLNVGKYPIKNAKQYYPDEFEKQQNLSVEKNSTVFLSVGPNDRDNIILPSRPGELQWTYEWNGNRLSALKDRTTIKWGIDYGTKITLTGKSSDIVIGGHGIDYIGPGIPMESWRAIAASDGSDWRKALTLPNLNISNAAEFYVATENMYGQRIHRALSVTKQPLGANTGKKVYVGGSNSDFIWGGDGMDTIYADRFDSAETFFPTDPSSRQRLYASAGLSEQSSVLSMQQYFNPSFYDAANKSEPGYVWWYDERPGDRGSMKWWTVEVFNNGYIDQLYQTTRRGLLDEGTGNSVWKKSPQLDGTHQINDPVWRPGGDTVYGGYGNDIIYGDNNTNNVARLAVIKQAFNKSGIEFDYNAEKWQALTRSFERDYGSLANDYIDAGPDNDVIHGGVGKDIIIGGSGRDIIYLPDAITAPGYKNVSGAPGTASWIMGDAGGVHRDPDLFVLGLNYTTEQAMIDSAVPDGGNGSTPKELEQQISDFNKEANNYLLTIASVAANKIPLAGSILSAMLRFADNQMKAYSQSQGKPSVDQKPSATDAVAVIVDFGPEDLIMIPVQKGEAIEVKPINDNSGLGIVNPADSRFAAKAVIDGKSTTKVQIDVGVERVLYPRLILQDFDNANYRFWRISGAADYDYAFYGNISTFGDSLGTFDPSRSQGLDLIS